MKLIKKLIILMLLVFVSKGCDDLSQMVTFENRIIETKEELSKDEVLDAIKTFKESIYELRATNIETLKMISALAEEHLDSMHSKDELVESNMNVGYDLEWLDMAVMVLNFAEAFTSSSDTLGVETLFYDVLDDPTIWGWSVNENTKVILTYEEEVLYIRVIDDFLIQTFFFEYVEEELIKIFRLFESATSRGNTLYIEDFIEKIGLSMWHSNGDYFMSSRVKSDDGGLYTFVSTNSDDKTFGIANYVINGVPLYVLEQSKDTLCVEYDFKYIDVFDSFTEDGVLFLNDEVVQMPLEMNVLPVYKGDNLAYILTGTKELSESTYSLQVDEANIIADITCEDIKSNIDSLLTSSEIGGISYDYSLSVEVILNELSELLYLDY
jgi:hypothetical protein